MSTLTLFNDLLREEAIGRHGDDADDEDDSIDGAVCTHVLVNDFTQVLGQVQVDEGG